MYCSFSAILTIIILAGCTHYPAGANSIISDYGSNTNAGFQKRRESHNGIDIGGKIGTPILAPADGIVVRSHWENRCGNRIVIDHGQDSDGSYIRTLYCHSSKNLVNEGDTVKRGQKIAELGQTGSGITSGIPHLHFVVYRGKTKNYNKDDWTDVNPRNYFIVGSKEVTCFNPTQDYPELPIKFTYPVECSTN